MEYSPITTHIAAMLEHLGEEPTRAVYMVVKELYRLETANMDFNTKPGTREDTKNNFDYDTIRQHL